MAQSTATYRQDGDSIDYTPVSAVLAGTVVIQKGLVGITVTDIAASEKGAVRTKGVFAVPKITGAIAIGDPVFWNATADPVSGTAGSGAANNTGGTFLGTCVLAAVSGDATVEVRLGNVGRLAQQGTPTAETSTTQAYLASEILGGIITSTQTGAVTGTLDTGANMDAIFAGAGIGDYVDWTLINLGSSSGAVTVTASSGHTIVGNAVVAIATSATFRSRKTAANTWVTYRLNG